MLRLDKSLRIELIGVDVRHLVQLINAISAFFCNRFGQIFVEAGQRSESIG